MPALTVLLCLLAVTAPCQPPPEEPSPRLTLKLAKRIVREQGARKAAESALDPYWGQLLDSIATADPGWLDLAAELKAHSDAEGSETLSAAMGEALRRAPREVLGRLNGRPFSLSGVCGNSFADSGIEGQADAGAVVAAQEIAVAGVKDAKLKQRRDACLVLIREMKRP